MKGGVARAIRTLRAAANPGPADRVAPLSPKMVGLRFRGGEPGRRRRARDRPTPDVGASTTDVMLARELEDEPDGGALLGRGNRRARSRGAVPLEV